MKLEKKNFTVMHCWLKLNGQPKWNLFITKTVGMGNDEETGDPTNSTKEPPKKQVRRGFHGKKWEEEKAKQEGAADKMTDRFEDMLAKKKRWHMSKRSDVKEACKAESFTILMEATDKKLKLEEKKT